MENFEKTLQCKKCDHIFHINRVRKNMTMSRCPNCSSMVKEELFSSIAKEQAAPKKKLMKRKCESCPATYYTFDDQELRLCGACLKKNTPHATIAQPRKFSKFDFKKAHHKKHINKLFDNANDCCKKLLSIAKELKFDNDDINKLGHDIVDYLTKVNCKRHESIKNFDDSKGN